MTMSIGRIARARLAAWTLAAAGSLCAACAGGPQLPALPALSAGLPDLSVAALATGGLAAAEPSSLPHTSAEIYARIARGANACWFGPRGRIASTHMLHADANPSMNGGAVEIVVHERAVDQPKPWGYKAFRVNLAESPGFDGTPGAGGTRISVENVRIADVEAARMRAEVFHWAIGNEGCKSDPATDKPVETAKAQPAAASPPPKKATGNAKPKALPQSQPK